MPVIICFDDGRVVEFDAANAVDAQRNCVQVLRVNPDTGAREQLDRVEVADASIAQIYEHDVLTEVIVVGRAV